MYRLYITTIFLSACAFATTSPVTSSAEPPFETVNVNISTPENNAPLNKALAYYRLNGTNGESTQLTHSFVPVSCGAIMSVHHTDPHVFADAGTEGRPILLLQHGYPESSYIWRKLTGELSKRVPLVVADVGEASISIVLQKADNT